MNNSIIIKETLTRNNPFSNLNHIPVMKHLTTILSTMALMLTTAFGLNATSVTNLEVSPVDNERVLFIDMETAGQGEVNIRILDPENTVIFSETVGPVDSYQKRYSLELLEEGNYTLRVEDEFKVTIQPIVLQEDALVVDNSERAIVFTPVVNISEDGKYLDVNWMLGNSGDYKFTLEYTMSSFSFDDAERDVTTVHKRYDIAKLPKGRYNVSISSANQTHYKTVTIN